MEKIPQRGDKGVEGAAYKSRAYKNERVFKMEIQNDGKLR